MFLILISTVLILSPTALGRPQEPAVAAAQPAPQQGGGSTPIPIVSQSAETKEDGGFSYSFETGNGIKVEETGTIKQGTPDLQGRSAAGGEDGENSTNSIVVLQGSFSYTAPDGQLISVRYIADENGFQPEGDHLPTPPPGLEEALKQNVNNQLPQGQPIQPQQPLQAQPENPPAQPLV